MKFELLEQLPCPSLKKWTWHLLLHYTFQPDKELAMKQDPLAWPLMPAEGCLLRKCFHVWQLLLPPRLRSHFSSFFFSFFFNLLTHFHYLIFIWFGVPGSWICVRGEKTWSVESYPRHTTGPCCNCRSTLLHWGGPSELLPFSSFRSYIALY